MKKKQKGTLKEKFQEKSHTVEISRTPLVLYEKLIGSKYPLASLGPLLN